MLKSSQHPLNLGLDELKIGRVLLAPAWMASYQPPHLMKGSLLDCEHGQIEVHPEQRLLKRATSFHRATMGREVHRAALPDRPARARDERSDLPSGQ
jgi:hypothetical protein